MQEDIQAYLNSLSCSSSSTFSPSSKWRWSTGRQLTDTGFNTVNNSIGSNSEIMNISKKSIGNVDFNVLFKEAIINSTVLINNVGATQYWFYTINSLIDNGSYVTMGLTRQTSNTSVLPTSNQVFNLQFLVGVRGSNGVDSILKNDIPIDFFISTTVEGSHLTYLTDVYKTIDLQQFSDIPVLNSNEIVRNGNDLFVIINWGGNGCIIALYDCYIYNNILTVSSHSIKSIGEDKIHGLIFHRNFLYASERPSSADLIVGGTNIIKINPYDLDDIKKLTIPYNRPAGNTYNGYTNDIVSYKDKLFVLLTRGGSNTGYFIQIDENLNYFKELFKCGHLLSTERVTPSACFIIYDDEIYIPTYSNIAGPENANTIGLSVFDFSGIVKRKVTLLPISSTATIPAIPHWAGIFNGKLIISFSNATSQNRGLVIRVDCLSLSLEEVYDSEGLITDDNTVFRNGYIYFNQEEPVNSKLIKLKYNDFTDVSIEILNYNNGRGSYGSINSTNLVEKETFNSYGLPVISNDQMLGMTNPIPGIYLNSTTSKFVAYNGTNWVTVLDQV